ncbi:predicted protein [Postia placenta Mad-698-R]|nr:predicted protein [Postia placenta Mad-698-R]
MSFTQQQTKTMRPWGLARVGGSAIGRLMSRPSLDEANGALASKDKTIKQLLGRVTNAESASIALQSELDEYRSSLSASEEEKRRAEAVSTSYQERFATLEAEYIQEHEGLQEALRQAEADLGTARNELLGHRTSATSKLLAVTAELNAERTARSQIETELTASRSQAEELETAQAQTQHDLEARTAELEQLTIRVEALVSQTALLHAHRDQLAAKVDDLESQAHIRQTLERDHDEALSRMQQLQARLAQSVTAWQQTAEEARRMDDELQQTREEAARHTQMADAQLDEARRHIQILEHEKLEALQRVAAIRRTREEVVGHFQHQIAIGDAEKAALQQTNVALRRHIDELSRAQSKDGSAGCIIQ